MSNASDFIIENGVLKKYVGLGGDVVIPEGVSSVGKKAFFKCNELLHITIPEGVAIIEASAFEECRSLVTTILPETLTGIGTSAFKRCSALVSVSIPNPECSIGDSAFRACRSLKDIVLPKGLKKIGKATFLGCDALGELTIPETVKTISDYAFADTDVSGQILPRQCACPLLTILGVTKMSDLVFGSSIKRSEQNAPPIWFANMPLADVPKPYKKAAAEGFMITWHKKSELVENQKDAYIKHLKSQRKKYYDRLIKEEELLYLFLRESILSKEDITALIDLGSAGISTEIKAMLLEYSK